MAAWPLNRRRTRLSMPLGFLQLGSTHLNRSLWCRLKRLGSAAMKSPSATLSSIFQRLELASQLTRGERDVRFLTIAMCLFAATMVNGVCDGSGRRRIVDGGCRWYLAEVRAKREIWSVRGLGKVRGRASPFWALAPGLRPAPLDSSPGPNVNRTRCILRAQGLDRC
jgi:hypothetical protein